MPCRRNCRYSSLVSWSLACAQGCSARTAEVATSSVEPWSDAAVASCQTRPCSARVTAAGAAAVWGSFVKPGGNACAAVVLNTGTRALCCAGEEWLEAARGRVRCCAGSRRGRSSCGISASGKRRSCSGRRRSRSRSGARRSSRAYLRPHYIRRRRGLPSRLAAAPVTARPHPTCRRRSAETLQIRATGRLVARWRARKASKGTVRLCSTIPFRAPAVVTSQCLYVC